VQTGDSSRSGVPGRGGPNLLETPDRRGARDGQYKTE
jgi:hypothetical protein